MAVAGIVCSELVHIPDQRLRVILRSFCRPFILHCPSGLHRQVILPFLVHLLSAMLQRLSNRWQSIATITSSTNGGGNENNDNIREVCDEIIARLLTRDYLDLLKAIVFTAPQHVLNAQQQMDGAGGGGGDDDEMMMEGQGQPSQQQQQQQHSSSVQVSELGREMLQEPQLAGPLLLAVLSSLWWPDTGNSIKAASIMETIVKFWASNAPASTPTSETATLCLQVSVYLFFVSFLYFIFFFSYFKRSMY